MADTNPLVQLDGKWFFFDETWSSTYGPYDTESKAREKLKEYFDHLGQTSLFLVDPVSPGEEILPSVISDEEFWGNEFEEAKIGESIPSMPTEEQSKIAWAKETIQTPKRVLSLKTVEDLRQIEGLIDAGYLSFVYGSRVNNYGGWHSVKMKYANYLLVLDSGGVRSKEYELYKSKRRERRDQYDYAHETYERVKIFREEMRNDPTVNTARIEGYEADDIIALLFLKGIGSKRVIAQDKDFFMVKGMREVMTDHTGIPQGYRSLKLPKYAIEPNKPATWALTQAIFGDKSDSIPRLLPSRTGYKEVYNDCIRGAPSLLSAFYNCLAEFGEQFEVNLRLVLLPHPTLSDQDYDVTLLLFEDLCSGEYWSPSNYDDKLLGDIVSSIGDMDW